MMVDIVDRLRLVSSAKGGYIRQACDDAADEIDRLRAEAADLRVALSRFREVRIIGAYDGYGQSVRLESDSDVWQEWMDVPATVYVLDPEIS